LKRASLKLALLVLALSTAAVGCSKASTGGGGTPPASTSTPQPTAATSTPAATPAETPKAAGIVVDEAKVTELLSQFGGKTPAKVVTVSVAITELLNELGVTPVGVPTSSSKLPASLDQVPRIGASHQPDLEQIAKLQPDFILGPASIKENLEKKFKPANLPAAYLPADSLEELKLSSVALGRLFKQESKAEAFLQKFEQAESAAVETAKGKQAPKVMFLFGSAESLMLMNENTFAGSLAKKLGASNVVSDVLKLKETYIPLNMESVVAANPDIILLVTHGDPVAASKKFEEDSKKNGAWEKLNASKNGKLIALDYNLFGIASIIKGPDAYNALAKILYN